uniref:Uncharacterized protein n=1 Tax=Arundo donax TaxID=35708 RepID=A0A0A9B8G7_ARUDO
MRMYQGLANSAKRSSKKYHC